MEHILKVLSYHVQIDAQISTNSCQIRPKDPQEHQEKLQAPCYSKFSRKEMIPSFTWHEMRQFQQPHHYTVCQWGFYPIVKTCKKWVMTLSSSMAMYLGHAWHTWCKKGTNRKRMSCSSPICHMQIFKSFDFRTMGLWIWITFILIRTVYTPFKKSNATQLWLIIFLLSWIFIQQVWYPWKACLFAFRLIPYLLGLFLWGACRVSKLGAMSKRKSCKIDRIEWEMHVISSFGLSFCECMHEYPLPFHCAAILPKYRRIRCNEWAVVTRAYSHKRKLKNLT